MKIKAIKLNDEEVKDITQFLTDKFDELNDRKQILEANLSDFFNCDKDIYFEAELELFVEYSELDRDTNSTSIIWRSSKFRITFFYDGEEIEVNSDEIYKNIETYYSI